MTQTNEAQRKQPEIINIKRNPYLVDYEEQRRLRERRTAAQTQQHQRQEEVYAQPQRRRRPEEVHTQAQRYRRPDTVHTQTQRRGTETARRAVQRTGEARQLRTIPVDADKRQSRRAAALRRKKMIYRRLAVCFFSLLLVMGLGFSMLNRGNAAMPEDGRGSVAGENLSPETEQTDNRTNTIQGLPAAEFAKHPVWTEDFLTPNEYSRPGEALAEVKNIFVHYTANPGTSAAQNRSYFEQQKDMHEASVSAHFIIGYEGEIIQCLPLDEIGYAVMTRNYDSVSIECCYKAKDGSFTQETYDSLITLLAWLVDAYDLEVEDILRHYDCGGKKCPLYYTENSDAWERLKEDVAAVK